MNRLERILFLNDILLREMPQYRAEAMTVPKDEANQRRLMRSLMNVRPPLPLRDDFLTEQDILLAAERDARGVVSLQDLPTVRDLTGEKFTPQGAPAEQIILWQGDITRLAADAIVNAANSELLGCFVPCHGCIDNAIHSAAGLELREACAKLMKRQGCPEPAGKAKITPGFNLPARYVLHTVGPIIASGQRPTKEEAELLASCYCASLALAKEQGLKSIAFCCISTGEFHFPGELAAEIALKTVAEWLRVDNSSLTAVFNVFKDEDWAIYRHLLKI